VGFLQNWDAPFLISLGCASTQGIVNASLLNLLESDRPEKYEFAFSRQDAKTLFKFFATLRW
jgi:hypothetical protein